MGMASAGLIDSHVGNGQNNDLSENEVFEDAKTNVESEQIPEQDKLVSFDGNDQSSERNMVVSSEFVREEGDELALNSDYSHLEPPCDKSDDSIGDLENTLTENDSSLTQKFNELPRNETAGGSKNREEVRSINCTENLRNEEIGDEVFFCKFESDEGTPKRHAIEEIQSEEINDIREDDEIAAEADSLFKRKGSANSDGNAENEDRLEESDQLSFQSSSASNEDPPKRSNFLKEGESISKSNGRSDDSFQHTSLASPSAPSPSRPAGLGSSAPFPEPAHRSLPPPRANGSVRRQQTPMSENSVSDDTNESGEIREKLQKIRVNFLRLAHRLGQTPHNVVVAQVLYRLGLAEQLRNTNRQGVFSFDRASIMAEQLEASGQEPLTFSCTIMVIGKTGVGKSATINSIFDDAQLHTNAFEVGTKKLQDVVGTVHGIKVRIIDTPGLSPCPSDQRRNEKTLNSIKNFVRKTPPDIVLYFDRMDMQNRDYGDVSLLRTITDVFGTSIWFNAIVVLTHAASAPPDGPNGNPLSYEMFVTQRSHVVQQAIRQAADDVRLMNPVSLVENHSACRINRAGQRVLPNGQVWKPQLLLLSFSSKILQEANLLLKLEDSPMGRPFGSTTRPPPLPFLLSSLLQTRPHLKLPEEQIDDEDGMFKFDEDDGSDYDELPSFKTLSQWQLDNLSKAQRNAYYEELGYRERLFFKKQMQEDNKNRNFSKIINESASDTPIDKVGESLEGESGGDPASVPVPLPDMVLPNTFDSDHPTHRYRFLDSSNKWLVRPVLETQGWDHDVGYEGLNVERLFVVKDRIPCSVSGQITKDKKDCSLQMEMVSSLRHSEGVGSSVGLDLQTVGKDLAYTLRAETKFKNFRCNNTAAGLSATILRDSMSTGAKIEDKLMLSRRLNLLISGGAMSGRGDVAYGGRLEATLRDKDFPIERSQSTIALSVVDWHGDLAVGCNIQSQHSIGRGSNATFHGNLSNKGSGQVGFRFNTFDQVQIAIIALWPIFRSAVRKLSSYSVDL